MVGNNVTESRDTPAQSVATSQLPKMMNAPVRIQPGESASAWTIALQHTTIAKAHAKSSTTADVAHVRRAARSCVATEKSALPGRGQDLAHEIEGMLRTSTTNETA